MEIKLDFEGDVMEVYGKIRKDTLVLITAAESGG